MPPPLTTPLLPDPASLHLEQLLANDAGITIMLTTTRPMAPCPECGQPSTRVPSWYRRTLADLPWQGLPVRLHLRTRRWFCSVRTCARRVFTERLPAVVVPYARRTRRLAAVFEAIALAVGGEAGHRLLQRLGLQTSAETLLRTIRAGAPPAAPTPQVLGVDDWAWRRGRRYGTILVDQQRHRVIDLLPDRTAESLAQWLRAPPGVAIITRDRAGAYADGARQGAPDAVQVADRWPLLKNLGEALAECLDRHRAVLRRIAARVPAPERPDEVADPSASPPRPPSADPTPGPVSPQAAKRARRRAQYEQVLALREQGETLVRIAHAVGLSRRTVLRFLAAGAYPEHKPRERSSSPLEPYRPYLNRCWAEGKRRGTILWREICAQGYPGNRATVYTYLARLRREEARAPETRAGDRPARGHAATRRYAPSRLKWLFLRTATELTAAERALLAMLQEQCTDLPPAYRLAQGFVRLVREHDGAALEPWLTEAVDSGVPELQRFAAGLRRDRAAVDAGLTETWSNGQTEGQITRLKLLKRQMYGRAGFALLRQRVLRAS
jgi:transposase